MSALLEDLITAYRRDRIQDVPGHAQIAFFEHYGQDRMVNLLRDWLVRNDFTVQISNDHASRQILFILDRDSRQIRHREAMLDHARTVTQIELHMATLTENGITGFYNPQLGVPFSAAKPARSLASGLQERRRHIQTTPPTGNGGPTAS